MMPALYRRGYNRIYDTLELEKNLDSTEKIISSILDQMDTTKPLSSEMFCRELGKWLTEQTEKPGVLRNAYLKNVPVYIPAFTDSELALDVGTWMTKKAMASDPALDITEAIKQVNISFNPFLDLSSYTTRILKAKRLGIFTIGGGVPRNWAQQVSPYLEILQERCQRALSLKRAPLWCANMPGTGTLGWIERVYLLGGGFLGQVCCSRGWRPLR